MCQYQKKIEELESKIEDLEQQKAQSELFKNLAEAMNAESQVKWRPWQVMVVGSLIPTLVALLALAAVIFK
ncbi:TPA: hypothetical protein ACRZZI_004986 [Vibrio harveyi]